jgi:hypothetical protein
MTRTLPFLLLSAAVSFAPGPRGDVPAKGSNPTRAVFPVGKWNVEFANGVKEVCLIGNGGETTVTEPGRGAHGMAEFHGGSFIITYNDNRVERWTPVGKRFVVEHWFPGSRLPTVTPVLGIADRIR